MSIPAWRMSAQAESATHVSDALSTAERLGKPLLVLLVPEDAEDQEGRLRLWSELLAFADDDTLAELCLCEVVCATANDGQNAVGDDWPEIEEDVIAVLVETDRPGAAVVSGAELPSVGRSCTVEGSYGLASHARTAELSVRLRSAILPDDNALARRAERAALQNNGGNDVYAILQGFPRPRLREVDRIAALTLANARGIDNDQYRQDQTALVARAALLRLWEDAPSGTEWHRQNTLDLQPLEDPCPACGMAAAVPQSRTFLRMYTGDK